RYVYRPDGRHEGLLWTFSPACNWLMMSLLAYAANSVIAERQREFLFFFFPGQHFDERHAPGREHNRGHALFNPGHFFIVPLAGILADNERISGSWKLIHLHFDRISIGNVYQNSNHGSYRALPPKTATPGALLCRWKGKKASVAAGSNFGEISLKVNV